MRVLVTGASGFVGGYLVAALRARGHDVLTAAHMHDGDVDLPLDLGDVASVHDVVTRARAETILHLAAQSFVPRAIADPLGTFDVNAAGTARLLEAVRALRDGGGPDPRIVVVGSAEVYGVQPAEAFPLRETVPPNPANPYAASKVAAEAFALAAARTYRLDVVVTRAFNHIGPGQDAHFVVPSFARQLAEIAAGAGPLLLVGNLEARRDFLDVRDVVAAYVALAERRGEAAEIYNVASGKAVAIREILRQLVMIARVPVEIRDDPARMRPSDVPLSVGDATKLATATGWTPEIPLAASLRAVYADARERVAAGR
jgi:GDP-4-dehydro-6-deoxy-D-mannose reductase